MPIPYTLSSSARASTSPRAVDVLNFNDMPSALMLLTTLLVAGGVPTPCMSGLALVSSGGLFGSTVFFFGFYYLVLNCNALSLTPTHCEISTSRR